MAVPASGSFRIRSFGVLRPVTSCKPWRLLFDVSVLMTLSLLLSIPQHAIAQKAKAPRVEIPVWERTLTGTLGTKPVNVSLNRVDNSLSGSYCYAPCSEKTRQQLALSGTIAGNMLKLTERDTQSTRNTATGRWSLTWDGDKASGSWTIPDGKKTFPVQLRDTQPLPFETRLVANAMPNETDDCKDPPHVTAIRIYRNGRLAQELPTDSQSTCGVFIPSVVDANFDGFPDLMIPVAEPAEPNTPQQTWLYDPGPRRFIGAPDILQGITSPEFDRKYKTIVSHWRNGCCEHGVTTYRWKGNKLEETGTATSVHILVLVGQKVLYCYSIPDYQDGRIEYPERVEQVGDRLTLTFDDFSSCDADGAFATSSTITVWQRDAASELKALRVEETKWKAVETALGRRYCPEIPAYTKAQIKRVVLSEPPETYCGETEP